MIKYIIKRLGMMLVAMFLIILLTFTIMHSIPGGPFTNDRKVSAEVEQALNEKYNLDAPLYEQFFQYLGGILKGDLGPSYKYTGKSVNDFIKNGFPVSAKLGLITIVFVLLASLPMGIVAAVKNGRWQDMTVMTLATVGVTIPSFVIASVLIYWFSFKLNWLPTYGVDSWKGYILPV
ncbi:MAG: ABC transporter permease, partial [Lachnospiraceae bacterium]